jgi:hypothetical protein
VLLPLVPATVVTDLVLPVVGALFAAYLLGTTVLVLLTVAMKLTASHGTHRLVLDLSAAEQHIAADLPPAALPSSNVVV